MGLRDKYNNMKYETREIDGETVYVKLISFNELESVKDIPDDERNKEYLTLLGNMFYSEPDVPYFKDGELFTFPMKAIKELQEIFHEVNGLGKLEESAES